MKDRRGEPAPRSCNYYGMKSEPQRMPLGTWLEPEEITYPSGSMIRRARAYNVNTGRRNVVRCGIPDTYFSIPVRGGGFLSVSDGGILLYYPAKKSSTDEA